MQDPSEHNHEDHQFDGFSIDEIKKNFKALGEELESKGTPIEDVTQDIDDDQSSNLQPYFRGYIPTIKDYLERAQTHDECEEIITYCLKQGEITPQDAEEYKRRLARGGPRAFGTRRPGYYDQKL